MPQPNKSNKFTIKKPRITLTEEQKKQARSGMAGEAVKVSAETTTAPEATESNAEVTNQSVSVPTAPETTKLTSVPEPSEMPALVTAPVPIPVAPIEPPTPERIVEEIAQTRQQGRGSRGRKAEKNIPLPAEDSETQHVRMSKDSVLKAKMNVLLLPPSFGIRSLRDYGDAAFAFYEQHLRKIGKLP
ncbi:hypothetical protein [Adhaeribacter rhizoryzae]|uniref:Uncharacterized protein n=1 Tax=Adhaeribacter rhizoryzae TaxID=2607907 RepID=A0A5M6CZM8_9BACT|nr:hypothetical protein [Adhaeribacter rhizoryzae]KAA5538739.1 hypothetical protein F0145_25695 [Adhaeribacter rhizoryzae]